MLGISIWPEAQPPASPLLEAYELPSLEFHPAKIIGFEPILDPMLNQSLSDSTYLSSLTVTQPTANLLLERCRL